MLLLLQTGISEVVNEAHAVVDRKYHLMSLVPLGTQDLLPAFLVKALSSTLFCTLPQVLGPGALGRPSGIGWSGRWEGGSGWGIHVNPWLIHVNV